MHVLQLFACCRRKSLKKSSNKELEEGRVALLEKGAFEERQVFTGRVASREKSAVEEH